ncbi:MAG: hypothetical protein ACR2JK_05665 [Geodermatophilaceae bacterium]
MDPSVGYAYEYDQAMARETRQHLLAGAAARGAVLGTAHLGESFTMSIASIAG